MKAEKISSQKYKISPDESKNSEFNADLLLSIIDECSDGAEIIFESGNYYFNSPEHAVKLNKLKKNITFKAMDGARFIGGKPISGASAVCEDIKERFFPEVREKILCIDLKKNGVDNAGEFISRGFGRTVTPSHSEIFADGTSMNLSHYPKGNNYLNITGYGGEEINEWSQKVGKLENGFLYECERPKKWADSDDILVHGYWSWDWANTYEKIAEINKESGKITTKEPYGQYAFKIGQRFNFHNILEEVTEYGDYYIDRKNMILYFIPWDNTSLPEEILISMLKVPLWTIKDCENLCFEGFSIEASCGDGISVFNSKNIKISDCVIKNIGNYPITIEKSRDVTVMNCDIHDCGDGGIRVRCGNRVTLEPGNIKIDNNHIYKIAKWTRTYQTAINATGVGIEITNNLIHDCPHTGILYTGNEIHIRNNEIYSALFETGDAGAIYTGRDYTYRGNIVSNNYIHHLGGAGMVGMGTMGIYNDDCVSGTVMEGNIFFEVSRAVFLGGGRDFQVRGNLFVDCYPSIEIDGRGVSKHEVWRNMVDDFMRDRFYNIKAYDNESTSAIRHPYITRYPELREIDNFYRNNLPIPPSAVIENNVYCSSRKLEFTWEYEPGEFEVRENNSISRDYFEDYEIGLLNIKDGTDAESYGFKRLDMFAYGLDEKRRGKNPPRVLTGLLFNGEDLIYRYKNLSDIAVKAKIILESSDSEIGFEQKQIVIDIEANVEGTVKIPFERINKTEKNKKSVTIDARADTAGIRPCRLKI